MTKIHMDIDSVQAVIQLLERRKGELEDFIKDVSIAVNGLVGTDWVGEAPDQYSYEYGELRGDLMEQVKYMQTLADFLRQAVENYKAAAAKLG